jgi:hypothetical protein
VPGDVRGDDHGDDVAGSAVEVVAGVACPSAGMLSQLGWVSAASIRHNSSRCSALTRVRTRSACGVSSHSHCSPVAWMRCPLYEPLSLRPVDQFDYAVVTLLESVG